MFWFIFETARTLLFALPAPPLIEDLVLNESGFCCLV